jgi:L-alanine-DL-glutamate epimerase-like enolase superfamily enzyme
MKIERAYTILTCPGRNFVTLKVVTDEGVHGLGDATLNGRELAVKAYLDDHVIPCLIGRDPRNIEDIWQYLYRGAYWRRGLVTMAAIAAVDVALWDIKGKLAQMPVSAGRRKKSLRRNGVLTREPANRSRRSASMAASISAKGSIAIQRRFACNPACPDSRRSTASARVRVITNRHKRGFRRKSRGIRRSIYATPRSSSEKCATRTDSIFICCMTRTIG